MGLVYKLIGFHQFLKFFCHKKKYLNIDFLFDLKHQKKNDLYKSWNYFDFNNSIFFLISPLLLLNIVVPETNILAPASIADL